MRICQWLRNLMRINNPVVLDNSVTTASIAAGAVTTPKLGNIDGAISTARLADGAVTKPKLADGAMVPERALLGITSDKTVPHVGFLVVPWDTEVIDTAGAVDLGSHPTLITVPAGFNFIRIGYSCSIDNDVTGPTVFVVLKNGTAMDPSASDRRVTSVAGDFLSIHNQSMWLATSPGDYYELRGATVAAADCTLIAGAATWFAAELCR
jgi:hypothetical protein